MKNETARDGDRTTRRRRTSSANVFVEEAVKEQLRQRRREKVYAAYAQAANDAEFMAELIDTTRAFDATVGDGTP